MAHLMACAWTIYGTSVGLLPVWLPNGVFSVISFIFLRKYFEIAGQEREFIVQYVLLGMAGFLSVIKFLDVDL